MRQLVMTFEQNGQRLWHGNDMLLMPFLNSKNGESSEAVLSQLFTEHADPICSKIVEFRTRNIFGIDYFERQKLHEDLKQEVRLKMLMQLRQLQTNPNVEPIYDFKSYVARITHNLIHDYFRTKFRPADVIQSRELQVPLSEIEEDTNIVGLNGKRILPNFASELEDKEERIYRLTCVWNELNQLPKNQCAAWLLKVEDKDSNSTLKWLPVFRIANIREIALAIGFDVEDLAQIWNNLPMCDQEIAVILKSTQRQVINWRKSANERLQRRIKKLLEDKEASRFRKSN
jgi:RNA polymerase sigma factor (sigma-70 family)